MMTRDTRPMAYRAWTALAGTFAPAAAMTMTFALLVFACVFVAVAGPRESLGFRTRALQQAFAATSATQDSVQADADWSKFDESVFGPSAFSAPGYGESPLTPGQIGEARGELDGALAATPLPLAPRAADWSSMTTAFNRVAGAAPSAQSAQPPQMEIIYRDVLGSQSRLISGRFPAASRAGPATGVGATTTFEIAVTQATAERFGLHPGSRLAETRGVTLVVTGIIGPVVPGSAFWTLDGVAATPDIKLSPRFREPLYWQGAAFVGPRETADLQNTFGGQGMDLKWYFPLSLGGTDADHAQALNDHLNLALNRSLEGTGGQFGGGAVPLGAVTLSSGLITLLASFRAAQAAVDALFVVMFTGLTVLGATALLLGVRLLAERRHGDLALMRARGASLRQLALLVSRGTVPAVLAAAAAAVVAVAVTPGATTPLAWWLAGVTVLVALAGPPLIVARLHRTVTVTDSRAADRAATRRTPGRRWVAEAAVVAAAAGGLAVLRNQGLGGGGNLYLSVAPLLVAAPIALLILRLYPLALRGLLRLSAGRAGAAGFVGLATAARASLAAALPAFALVLALAMAAFGGMIRGAVVRGEIAASWQTTGGDARIDLSGTVAAQIPAAQHVIAATAGVRHSATAVVTQGSLSNGTQLAVAAVDPASYARLTADTPLPHFRPAVLARPAGRANPVPVLASPAAIAAFRSGGTLLQLNTGNFRVRVAGALDSTPALTGSPAAVVLPLWALHGRATPNLILATGQVVNQKRLTAALSRVADGAAVSFRSDALAALSRAPLQHGTYVAFATGIAAAAGLSGAVLLLSLALGARSRDLTLGRLSAMGLRRRQRHVLVAAEAVPAMLAAAAGGAICAWVLAPLIGPAIDLSVFTGSAAPVPVRAESVTLLVPAVGLVILGLATLAAQTAFAGRRRVGRALGADG